MKKPVSLSWSARGHMYFKPDNGFYDRLWKKAKAKTYGSVSEAGFSYWNQVADAASIKSFERDEKAGLISVESLPENSSMLGFKSFAKEYPEKLFPLVYQLRPEFQELFVEYYLLEKPQSFMAEAHGQVQTRIWQNLRIIEKAVGALIVLGKYPDAKVLRPIIAEAGLEETKFGSLTDMVLYYAASQSYAVVAKKFRAPVSAIRKIFRPAVAALLDSKDLKASAVGAYLKSMTHKASLNGTGLSKSCKSRLRKVKSLKFKAPSLDDSPLLSFGDTSSLQNTPWCMLEISSDHRMTQILPVLREHGKKIFGKKPAQIFAPVNADGELSFGYIFARSVTPSLVRTLVNVRGISEMSSTCSEEGAMTHPVTIPHIDVWAMVGAHKPSAISKVHVGDFVEILSGPAARYCGTVEKGKRAGELKVVVKFPTGRHFIVTASESSVKILPDVPAVRRAFWGVRI